MSYAINIKNYNVKEQFVARKENIKITNIFWVPVKWEFDYEMIGMVYIYHSSILIWLN